MRIARRIALALALAGPVAGCSNPLVTRADEYGRIAAESELHEIDVLALPAAPEPERPGPEEASPGHERPDPFANKPVRVISIEACRAWTLENNLDLHVAMIDPRLAETVLSEEEARFEALFVSRASVSDAEPGQSEVFRDLFIRPVDVQAGVRMPLRTGGSLEVTPAYSRRETFPGFLDERAYATDLDFRLSQPLLRDAGRWTNTHFIRIAALDTQIAEARTKLEVIRQIAAADRAYWLLYRARKLLEIRVTQHGRAVEQLVEAVRRFEGRVGPEIEVVRAEAGVSRRVESIILAELAVMDAQRTLKRVINLPEADVDSEVVLELDSDPVSLPYALDSDELIAAALDKRVELLELELRLAQDISSIEYAENQKLPLFTVDYLYRIHGAGSSGGGAVEGFGDDWGWQLGANIEIPIGNEAAEARYQRAVASRLQRLSSRSAIEQAVKQEVLDAMDNLAASWQRIEVARRNRFLEERNWQAERGQYRLGRRNSTEVLDAENRLADASAAVIAAVVDYQVAQVDLAFATGMLLGASKVAW